MSDVGAIVLCKWHPILLDELLMRTSEVYVVLDDADMEMLSSDLDILAEPQGVYRVTSFDSVEELSSIAVDLNARGVSVARVVGHTELSQYGAGLLELLLGESGGDPLKFVAYRDKRLMKQRVRSAGVRTAQSCSLTGPDDVNGARHAREMLRFPVVVKPTSGLGAVSTLRVDRAEDLADVLAGFTFGEDLRSRRLIIEEFVSGQEICIDAIWSAGKALSFVVHSYYIPRLALTVESLSVDPGLNGSRVLNEADEPNLYHKLREFHEKVNRALGICNSVTHLEAFIESDGQIKFSEIATRMGGAWVPRMLSSYLGSNVWAAVADAVVSGTSVSARPKRSYVGGLNLAPLQPGVITSMPSHAELADYPGVIDWQVMRKQGDRVRRFHPSDWGVLVVLGAESVQEYDELRRRVAQRFRILTSASASALPSYPVR